jgi:transposase
MAGKALKSVKTKGVGFAPILKYFFDKSGIAETIDNNVPRDPRRKTLTHGQAAVAMITGILFQVSQLYKFCQFADETTVLGVILPGIAPDQYFDDRLADTLDAIFRHGIGGLELLVTKNMIGQFDIESPVCHNDTTSVPVFGEYPGDQTGAGIKITFGHSKKHREDLKRFAWSLSVSSDSGFPLFQKACSGNTADVDTYVEQWHNLIDLLGHRDFLYVADSKLATHENMAHIHDNDGFFIAPLPMCESYKKVFHDSLAEHGREMLIPYKGRFNRGFEVPVSFEHGGETYSFRMIILFDHGVAARWRHSLENRIEKTRAAFGELNGKLNKYNLKTKDGINEACLAILKKNQTARFFEYEIRNDPVTSHKNKKRGRPGKNAEKAAVTKDRFSVAAKFDEQAFDEELLRCGWYPLVTNMSEDALPVESAMIAHKDRYKSEHQHRRAKSGFGIEPIYIHTPKRIEAFLFLFKIALQLLVLVERTSRKGIAERDRGLESFMPNRKDVRNPRTENLLAAFQYVVGGKVVLANGKSHGFVSELTELQKDILSLLDVPPKYFTYEFLFGSG